MIQAYLALELANTYYCIRNQCDFQIEKASTCEPKLFWSVSDTSVPVQFPKINIKKMFFF